MDKLISSYRKEVVSEIITRLVYLQRLLRMSDKGEQIRDMYTAILHLGGHAKAIDDGALIEITNRLRDVFCWLWEMELSYNRKVHQVLLKFTSVTLENADLLASGEDLSEFYRPIKNDIFDLAEMRAAIPNQIRYLVVDDEWEIIEVLESYITTLFKSAWQKSAKNGEEALQMAMKEEFDFIVTDFKMPKKNGSELVRELRQGDGPNTNTPIIMLSGYRPVLEANQKIWENVFFLDKPLSIEQFEHILSCCYLLKENQRKEDGKSEDSVSDNRDFLNAR